MQSGLGSGNKEWLITSQETQNTSKANSKQNLHPAKLDEAGDLIEDLRREVADKFEAPTFSWKKIVAN